MRALPLPLFRTVLLLATVQSITVPAPASAGTPSARALELAGASKAKLTISPTTGRVTFIRTGGGRGATIPAAPAAHAVQRARAFLDAFGHDLGLPVADDVVAISASDVDEAGFEHVRFQQTHGGIVVAGAELTVHLRGEALTALHARIVDDVSLLPTTPVVSKQAALAVASNLVLTDFGVADAETSDPRLEFFNRGLFEDTRTPTQLTWFIRASALALDARIWIDAMTGTVVFHVNQVPHALNRLIYDLANNSSTPLPGTLVRPEGAPATGISDIDDVYDFTADTYNYYMSEHGRDSFDGAGAAMIASVRNCGGCSFCPCPLLAFWNGSQAVFGVLPTTLDDVVAHEWTHGVTQTTAGLIYYKASGALSESYSDIFGETVDLTNGSGYDGPGTRWRFGESSAYPPGARSMVEPETSLHEPGPGKMSSHSFACTESDSGGVHSNSGIGNHAFALMVDGGTFNGFTITGIGLTKAGKIQYRALTNYLTPTSTYPDNYDALLQSCNDLVGVVGITIADCVEVQRALDAVEMYAPWPCTCGNGLLDPDEDCDDGNQVDGDCCSSLCQAANAGDPCSDGDGCTSDDTCQTVGSELTCIGTAGPRNDCRGAIDTNSARIAIKNTVPNKKDRFSFNYGKGQETLKSEFGDPTAVTTDYAFCLYRNNEPIPLHQISLSGGTLCKNGRPCWKDTKKGYRYSDSTAGRGGVTSLRLSGGAAGKVKISLRAKGDNLVPPDLSLLDGDLTAQIISSAGTCWDARFTSPPARSTSEVFKDRGE